MGKILDKVCEILAVAGCLLLLFITFSIAYSIFARPLNLPSLIWVVQFNEYALLWITFLGTGWLLSRDKHVSIQILTHRLGKKMNKRLALIHNIIGTALCGILCWYGAQTTVDHFIRKVVDVQSIDILKGFVIMVIPLGFFLLTLQFLRKIIVLLSAKEKEGAEKHPDAAFNKNTGISETGGKN
jgi:C4-dicarboxylate transporter, DctQ subunit